MTQELRERVADIYTKAEYGFPFSKLEGHSRKRMLNSTDAAIAIIRAETLEEAAKVAEMLSGKVRPGNIAEALYIPPTAKDAAAAIRALKEKA